MQDQAATCCPQPRPHNGALVSGRPVGSASRPTPGSGPCCAGRRGAAQAGELGARQAGPTRPRPCAPSPVWLLCQRPMDERVGWIQEESSTPRAPFWGVSGRHPSLASLCSPDLRLLTAKTWAVDARAAPGLILLLPGHILRKGPSGTPLGTGTKLTGPGLCPHWEAWVHLAWDTGFRGSEWYCYSREGECTELVRDPADHPAVVSRKDKVAPSGKEPFSTEVLGGLDPGGPQRGHKLLAIWARWVGKGV